MQAVDGLFQKHQDKQIKIRNDSQIRRRLQSFVKSGETVEGFDSIQAEKQVAEKRRQLKLKLMGYTQVNNILER